MVPIIIPASRVRVPMPSHPTHGRVETHLPVGLNSSLAKGLSMKRSCMASLVCTRGPFFPALLTSEPHACSHKRPRASRVASLLLVTALAYLGSSIFAPPVMAQTCSVSSFPHSYGMWRTLPYLMPINPISATLLNTKQVLIIAGSENDAKNNSPGAESYRNAIWDPTGTTQSSITVQNIDYDVFCSGTAVLPDGRALVVGGTSDYSFTGDNRASIFDPATGRFVQSQSMVDGRWYATATVLGDGRIMTFSGLSLSGGTNNTVEIYDLRNAGAGWTSPVAAPFSPPLYPHMLLLPNGSAFYTGQGSGSNANSWIFDPVPRTWTKSVPTTRDRTYGSAVLLPLLPPSYTPKVMNFGGGSPATATTEIIDLSAASPSWQPGPNMSTGRIQMNAVILPNGKVLAEGGSVNNESPNPAGKQADLYDPVTNTFSSAGTASYSRLYHSVALLLPDATVMSMGSNPGPRGNYEPAIEIYTPAYLFDANDHLITNRPSITGITPTSAVIGYGTSFSVTYTNASVISSAVLVRPGSTTHTFDMEQRLIGLCGSAPQPPCNGSGSLTLTSPPNGNIAPPGYYMLFLLDSAGVPSMAQFIQLSLYATAPPVGTIASPASDTTVPAGGSVFFSTASTAAKYSWVFPGGSPADSTAQSPGNVTFSEPGTYVTSLTVIDDSGNSDDSPPTRTITVLPPSADFSIAVSPSSQAVIPGQSATFTVTVTPLSGFSGAVSLNVGSENGFPSGITSGGFSPSSIAGSGGSSTLTMNTTTSATPYALSLTITGTSGNITHTASTTLLVHLAAPASLTATPTGNAGQVALSWPASVGATSYHVKRATVSGGPYTTVACTTTTTYTDTGLINGTTYYYVVSAAYSAGPNAGGESPDSSVASATPQAPPPPAAPTGLTATPGNTQVALTWNASAGANSYNVKRATISGGPYTTIASPSLTSYTDTGLTSGTTYYYVVTAVNSAGESGNSSQVSATPQAPTPPAAPTSLTASSGPPKGGVSLRWTQSTTPGVTQNKVYRRTDPGSYPSTPTATISAATSHVDTKLNSGTRYCYVVTAVVSNVESAKPQSEACAKAK
jgi:fibronectin type 3 domain-containing protein